MDPEQVGRLPRWRAVRGDAGLAAAGVAAVAVLHFRDPHGHGAYGLCPFYAITGWWCPACGGLRAVNDLTNGQVVASLHSNVLLLPFVATVLWYWGAQVWRRWTGQTAGPSALFGRTSGLLIVVAVAVFTVLRNTPWGHWIAPA